MEILVEKCRFFQLKCRVFSKTYGFLSADLAAQNIWLNSFNFSNFFNSEKISFNSEKLP